MEGNIGKGQKKMSGVGQIIEGGEMTSDGARRFLEAAEASGFHSLFALALTSGMRPSEYLGLKWEDVNFDLGNVTVKRTMQWKAGGWEFGDTKIPNHRRLNDSLSRSPSIICRKPRTWPSIRFRYGNCLA